MSKPIESDACVSGGCVLPSSQIRNHRLVWHRIRPRSAGFGRRLRVGRRNDASSRLLSARIAAAQSVERFDQRLIRQMSPCRSLGGPNAPDGRPRQCRQAWSGRHEATKPPRSDRLAGRTPPNAPATYIWRTTARGTTRTRTTARDDTDADAGRNRAPDDTDPDGRRRNGTTAAAGTGRWPPPPAQGDGRRSPHSRRLRPSCLAALNGQGTATLLTMALSSF